MKIKILIILFVIVILFGIWYIFSGRLCPFVLKKVHSQIKTGMPYAKVRDIYDNTYYLGLSVARLKDDPRVELGCVCKSYKACIGFDIILDKDNKVLSVSEIRVPGTQ